MTGRLPALGLLAAAVFLCGCSKDPNRVEEYEVEVGYRGPARTNPFLAAERFLNEMGLEATEQFSLMDLPDSSVVLLVPAESVAGTAAAIRLLGWVDNGGHLIYLARGGDAFFEDWGREIVRPAASPGEPTAPEAEPTVEAGPPQPGAAPGSAATPEEEAGEEDEVADSGHPLLDELGVRLKERSEPTTSLRLQDGRLQVEIPKGKGFGVPRWRTNSNAFQAGPRPARSFVSFEHGDGRISLLADAKPWRNRYIGQGDHAQFLWETVNLHPDVSTVWLMRGTRLSFWGLLWRYGWMPILSLLVFIIFWLWKNLPRFGPLLPEPEPALRDFASHLGMTGAFLWKRGSLDALLAPVRRRIVRRYQNKYLLDAQTDPDKVIAGLAVLSGQTEAQVREALRASAISDAGQFTHILRTLQKLDAAQ